LDAQGGHTDRRTGLYHFHRPRTSTAPAPQPNATVSVPAPAPKSQQPPPAASSPPGQTSQSSDQDPEAAWKTLFIEKVTPGAIDATTSGESIDILTSSHAVEVEQLSNYAVGIAAARRKARAAAKPVGLALYAVTSQDSAELWADAKVICEARGVTVWLLNDYLATPLPAVEKPDDTSDEGAGRQPSIAADQIATIVGSVVSVHDGDTLTVLVEKTSTKIRLFGIDAPELDGQPFGQAAKQGLSERAFGRKVQVHVTGKDRYGRVIGRVFVDGRDINAELVASGFAWWYVQYAPEDDTLKQSEATARAERRGLWQDPAPVAPWEWRKQKRAPESKDSPN
jgi:endonuclease YncB( thermonuclease family)